LDCGDRVAALKAPTRRRSPKAQSKGAVQKAECAQYGRGGRDQGASGHRRGDLLLPAAPEVGAQLQSAVPLPLGEDTLFLRLPGGSALALFRRLRRGGGCLLLRNEERGVGLPHRAGGTGATRGGGTAPGDPRPGSGGRGEPPAAGGAGRRRRLLRSSTAPRPGGGGSPRLRRPSRPERRDRHALRSGLQPARLGQHAHPPDRAGLHRGGTGTRRPAGRERRRRHLRPLPRAADDPYPRRARPGDRLRRAHARPRRRAEVPEFAADTLVRQGPHPLRPRPGPRGDPSGRPRRHRRGVHGRVARPSGGFPQRGGADGHCAHRDAGAAAGAVHPPLHPGPRPRCRWRPGHPARPGSGPRGAGTGRGTGLQPARTGGLRGAVGSGNPHPQPADWWASRGGWERKSASSACLPATTPTT